MTPDSMWLSMIDMKFWQTVADKWTTVLDFDQISKIKADEFLPHLL